MNKIIADIQTAYEHFQRPFSASEYKQLANEKGLVTYDYALYHSRKTWRELLQLAGVPIAKAGRKPERVYTKDDILDAIIAAARIQGNFPTLREYRALSPRHKLPSWRVLSEHGTWAELLSEAQNKILNKPEP